MKENTTLNIADFLTDIGAVGRNQAILSPKLCEMIGCNSSELKAAVHTERKAGALICSDINGYYMAENKQTIASQQVEMVLYLCIWMEYNYHALSETSLQLMEVCLFTQKLTCI